jgi:hypothetical protein
MHHRPSTQRPPRFVRACALVAVLAGLVTAPAAEASTRHAAPAESPAARPSVQIFYRSPVLVRPGEPLRIPVDAVCSIDGRACPAEARLSLVRPGGSPVSRAAPSVPGLQFDLTRAASRLGTGGRLDFRLSASGEGSAASLPEATGRSLHVYVAPRMREVAMPGLPFGGYRIPQQVLFLPWGSGAADAGLSAGEEAATLGPSSFAVGPDGSIHVADVLHQRILVFRGGRLVGATHCTMSPRTDLAVAGDGRTFLASDLTAVTRQTRFTVLDRSGRVVRTRSVAGGILGQVGTDGSSAWAQVLPLDAWLPFPGTGRTGSPATGLPLAGGGMMLRSIVGQTIRLGTATGDRVAGAVELRSSLPLGDLSFAATDGTGGYVAVARTIGATGDQYEVTRVAADRAVRAFAVPSHQFAQTMPHSRFRLGPGGAMYQLTTSPDGVRILRYSMGGAR